MINTSRDIKVGQFYRANGAEGYYYVGIKIGRDKRLVCLNLDDTDVGHALNPLFPNDTDMYQQWEFVPCSQHEASNCR